MAVGYVRAFEGSASHEREAKLRMKRKFLMVVV
jgi:hypothetical protein